MCSIYNLGEMENVTTGFSVTVTGILEYEY